MLFPILLIATAWGGCTGDVSLSSSQVSEILFAHNNLRKNEGASDMKELKWNEKLAQMASSLVNNCIFMHDTTIPANVILPYSDVGQNLYAGTSLKVNYTSFIMEWFNEKPKYNFATKTCAAGFKCGHYTQIYREINITFEMWNLYFEGRVGEHSRSWLCTCRLSDEQIRLPWQMKVEEFEKKIPSPIFFCVAPGLFYTCKSASGLLKQLLPSFIFGFENILENINLVENTSGTSMGTIPVKARIQSDQPAKHALTHALVGFAINNWNRKIRPLLCSNF
ncbi:hypothetical protein HELRODRAFT_175527 [Helobdella robusta]|uniref:SCP domain-containing protein n=1 Tax=Helobdella robusta TaxID=6412 RepID=T1F9C9_HELRO|nr:hypothetical protein HELRODRAFT_175527 [Helobdella robusta]ESO00565.1 hypothetical protein HELRODRAFT_175527 [Helobdella robusta]